MLIYRVIRTSCDAQVCDVISVDTIGRRLPYLREGDRSLLAVCARGLPVIKTLKQLPLSARVCHEPRGKEAERDSERAREAAARSNCAIVSCHLDVCTTNCDDARDERGRRRCIMCLGRTVRSRERRDHPRTNATMKQSRNRDSRACWSMVGTPRSRFMSSTSTCAKGTLAR